MKTFVSSFYLRKFYHMVHFSQDRNDILNFHIQSTYLLEFGSFVYTTIEILERILGKSFSKESHRNCFVISIYHQ